MAVQRKVDFNKRDLADDLEASKSIFSNYALHMLKTYFPGEAHITDPEGDRRTRSELLYSALLDHGKELGYEMGQIHAVMAIAAAGIFVRGVKAVDQDNGSKKAVLDAKAAEE